MTSHPHNSHIKNYENIPSPSPHINFLSKDTSDSVLDKNLRKTDAIYTNKFEGRLEKKRKKNEKFKSLV